MNNKLLIVSTFFPPMNQIAAVRLRSIVKILIRNGWDVYIATDVDLDYKYSNDIWLAGATIIPINQYRRHDKKIRQNILLDIGILLPVLKKYGRSLISITKGLKWAIKAIRITNKVIDDENIGFIMATVPSIWPLIVISKLKRNHKLVTSICEYRDIIANNKVYQSMFAWFEDLLNVFIESRASKHIDKYIFLTKKIEEHYNTRFKCKSIVITNGFDDDEYRYLKPNKCADKLVINHIGHLYGQRDPMPIIEALLQLYQEDEQYNKIQLVFFGEIEYSIKQKIESLLKTKNIENIILHGSIEHDKVLLAMISSDVNLIITHSSSMSEYAIPGKLFEYMGAKRPIFALTTDQLLKDIIFEHNLGWYCDNNISQIKEMIKYIYVQWKSNNLIVNSINIDKYDRNHLVNEIIKFITVQ